MNQVNESLSTSLRTIVVKTLGVEIIFHWSQPRSFKFLKGEKES